MSTIPMNCDLFCLDCESIGTNPRQCEPCGSRALYPMRAWLARKPAIEAPCESGIERYWREEAANREREIGELERMYR